MSVVPRDHIVQFFDHDPGLVSAASEYLGVTLETGGVGVAIATVPHLAAIEVRLKQRGIDSRSAQEAERLFLHDADSMMAKLTTNGQFDRDALFGEIEQYLDQWLRVGRPLRIYGELVTLLWQAGDVLGALALEGLWNDLAQSHTFSLYCTYPAALVSGPEHTDALAHLEHLHSGVLDTPTFHHHETQTWPLGATSQTYDAEVGAVGRARHFTAMILRSWGYDAACADGIILATGELTTNAVVHARSEFSLTLSHRDGVVRVEVRDAGATVGDLSCSTLTPRPGRGLGVVATLSRHWGVTEFDHGKVVWAEFEMVHELK